MILTDKDLHIAALREQGYRLTPQRVMVLDTLAKSTGHVPVDQIVERLKQEYPYIDLATVYRTLQLLTKLHMVTEIRTSGVFRYELVSPDYRHHHMVCEECDEAIDLSPTYMDELREQLLRDVGFDPHMEHFTISGMCGGCRITNSNE